MRRDRASFAIALAAVLAASCTGPPGSTQAAELVRSDASRAAVDPVSGRAAAMAIEALAGDLYGQLAREPGNLIFSPYSVAVALAMTRAGAAGETATQMDAVLHAAIAGDLDKGINALEQELAKRPGKYPVSGKDTVDLELATANQLWAQKGFPFETAFLDRLAANYGAGVRLVDYVQAREQARAAINEWVADRTKGRIPKLIPEGVLNELTRLVLTNAIYLKAKWVFTFSKGATAPGPFQRLDGSESKAQMMRLSARVNYGRGADYQAVRLPYFGGLSMIVVVPDRGSFVPFEQSLARGSRIREVIGSLKDAQVVLRLPKFEFRKQTMLKRPLSELGMPIAFHADDADLAAMSPRGRDMFIQDVVHEGFISVDEEGTEAAAATAVIVGVTSGPPISVELTVDRPFLFLVRDDATGAVLFMGRVVDPT